MYRAHLGMWVLPKTTTIGRSDSFLRVSPSAAASSSKPVLGRAAGGGLGFETVRKDETREEESFVTAVKLSGWLEGVWN